MGAWTDAEKTIERLAEGDLKAKETLDNLHWSHSEDDFSSVVYGLRILGIRGRRIEEAYSGPGQKDLITFVRLVRERNPVLDRFRS